MRSSDIKSWPNGDMNAVQSIARQGNAEVPFVDLGQEALSTECVPHLLHGPGMSAISFCNSCFRHLVFLNMFLRC